MRAIPLTSPDHIVYAWACGTCHHVHSSGEYFGYLGDPLTKERVVSESAEQSRVFADKCCTCQECGGPLPKVLFDIRVCPACKPAYLAQKAVEDAEWEDQRKKEQEARDQTLLRALNRTAALQLEDEMRDISEDHYCAGWLSGLEYTLWSMLQGGDTDFGFGSVSPHRLEALRQLSQQAGGWWRYDEFVPMDEWVRHYAEHQKQEVEDPV